MNDVDFEQFLQLVKNRNKEGLRDLPNERLVDFIIKLNSKHIKEEAERQGDRWISYLCNLNSRYGSTEERGTFINRMRDMEQQLAETEAERDNLREKNEELEEELELTQERMEELEHKLNATPKAGRPDKYDAKFRAEVRAYYHDSHTYRETADHFNISTNTVGRFLKE